MSLYESPRKSQALAQVRGVQSRRQRFEAPIGGLNTLDAIDNVPPTDALVLDNWIPDMGSVRIRGGKIRYYEGQHKIKTMAQYYDQNLRKFVVIDDKGEFIDITIPSAPVTLHTFTDGTVSDPFTFAIIENESSEVPGQMAFVNGSCTPVKYNGSAVTTLAVTGTKIPVSSAIPLDPKKLIGVHSFKNRLYYWEVGSQNFWYSNLYSVEGELTEFPLGATGNYGGSLVGIATWTRDGGSGPDDFIVFFMSGGDAIVYQGSSPEDIYNWSIVGRYHIGEPIDNRAIVKIGGDVIVTTEHGYVSLSRIVQGVEAEAQERKIDGAFREVVNRRNLFGWESISFPKEKIVIFNYPSGLGFEQHVMNIGTEAWCRFRDINAQTFCVFNNNLYHSEADGNVYQTLAGFDDDGLAIKSDMQPAWVIPGALEEKTILGWRPIFRTNQGVAHEINFGIDYEIIPLPGYPPAELFGLTPWSAEDYATGGTPVTYWTDEGSGSGITTRWSSSYEAFGDWDLVEGHGAAVSSHMRMQTKQYAEFLGYWYLFEFGERL